MATPAYSFERADWIQWSYRQFYGHQLPRSVAKSYSRSVEKWSRVYKLDADWMTANFTVESHWDTKACDGRPTPSWGIPQLQVKTAQIVVDSWNHSYLVDEEKLKDNPGLSIRISCKHFRDLLNEFQGDYIKATRAYNAGSSKVKGKGLAGMVHFERVLYQYKLYKMN